MATILMLLTTITPTKKFRFELTRKARATTAFTRCKKTRGRPLLHDLRQRDRGFLSLAMRLTRLTKMRKTQRMIAEKQATMRWKPVLLWAKERSGREGDGGDVLVVSSMDGQ